MRRPIDTPNLRIAPLYGSVYGVTRRLVPVIGSHPSPHQEFSLMHAACATWVRRFYGASRATANLKTIDSINSNSGVMCAGCEVMHRQEQLSRGNSNRSTIRRSVNSNWEDSRGPRNEKDDRRGWGWHIEEGSWRGVKRERQRETDRQREEDDKENACGMRARVWGWTIEEERKGWCEGNGARSEVSLANTRLPRTGLICGVSFSRLLSNCVQRQWHQPGT